VLTVLLLDKLQSYHIQVQLLENKFRRYGDTQTENMEWIFYQTYALPYTCTTIKPQACSTYIQTYKFGEISITQHCYKIIQTYKFWETYVQNHLPHMYEK